MANHTIAQERETLQGKLRQADSLIAECETLLERASAAKVSAANDLERAYDVRTSVLNEIADLRARSDAEFDAMLTPAEPVVHGSTDIAREAFAGFGEQVAAE